MNPLTWSAEAKVTFLASLAAMWEPIIAHSVAPGWQPIVASVGAGVVATLGLYKAVVLDATKTPPAQ